MPAAAGEVGPERTLGILAGPLVELLGLVMAVQPVAGLQVAAGGCSGEVSVCGLGRVHGFLTRRDTGGGLQVTIGSGEDRVDGWAPDHT